MILEPSDITDPLENRHAEGATVIDCGDIATVVGVETDGDAVTYRLEYEDGDTGRIDGRELELGKIDGTVRVIP